MRRLRNPCSTTSALPVTARCVRSQRSDPDHGDHRGQREQDGARRPRRPATARGSTRRPRARGRARAGTAARARSRAGAPRGRAYPRPLRSSCGRESLGNDRNRTQSGDRDPRRRRDHRRRARALEAQGRDRAALPRLRDRLGDAAERGVAPSPRARAARRRRDPPLPRLPRRDRALPLPRRADRDHADRPRDRQRADLDVRAPPRGRALARDPARDPERDRQAAAAAPVRVRASSTPRSP